MSSFEWSEGGDLRNGESLTLSPGGAKGVFQVYTGMSGEYWISMIPSLNISGYGTTEEESVQDLKDNTNVFFTDLFEVEDYKRRMYLKELGWKPNRFFKKKYSKAYVDENGVLQNFDNPTQVKRNVYQAA